VLRSLRLVSFKGFERFTVAFQGDTFFAGPNNAGKSTLIAALRAVAYMQRIADRRRADSRRADIGAPVPAYAFRPEEVHLVDENLKYEFRENETTRLEARFTNGTALFAIWPGAGAEDVEPFFYIREKDGGLVDRPATATAALPEIGVVPVLSPVEQEETVLSEKYVRASRDGRLASRHCRNQLRLLKSDFDEEAGRAFDDFASFIEPWLPELTITDIVDTYAPGGPFIDVFYTEPGSSRQKELFWAGDGIQIWLQLLLHLYRLRDADIVILDEPEVFLHADLQRRLVRILHELSPQAITATHSSEMMATASPRAVAWVARNRKRAVSAPDQATLGELSRALGTQFNLKIARALRTRVALFVEGKDMEIVRNIAATLGLSRVAAEAEIAVMRLEGFSNWDRVQAFHWMTKELLEDSVKTMVILDRDYRSTTACEAVSGALAELGIGTHVWQRKELESYLIHVPTIATLSGADEEEVADTLDKAAASLEHKVAARLLDERQREEVRDKRHRVTITERFNHEFDEVWADVPRRLDLAPPDDLLSALNSWLQEEDHKPVNSRQLSREIPADGIPGEMSEVLGRVERLAAD
jgi:hypothetical protein